jgi:hypothetical protein
VVVVLYTNRSASVTGLVASVSVVSRWAQALLASSVFTEAASLAESVLKVVRKQSESCSLRLSSAVASKTRALKALLHLSLLSPLQKTMYCLYRSSKLSLLPLSVLNRVWYASLERLRSSGVCFYKRQFSFWHI